MNEEAFYYYYMYGALQIYLLTYLLTFVLTYLGKSDVYHNKNKYKR